MRTMMLILAAISPLLMSTACGEPAEDDQQADVEVVEPVIPDTMPTAEMELVYASHVLVPFQGCAQFEGTTTREEALAEIQAVRDSVDQGLLTFAEAAARHSACPSSQNGGFLGSFPRGAMVPEFEEVAFGLGAEELSQPFETEFGYHIVLRHGTIRASHILAAYQGSVPDSSVTRTREEALVLIESVRDSIEAGMAFADAATAFSDCPSKQAGGDLGPFSRNIMDPTFSDSAFVLEPGEMSGIVETPFGFHLILRTE
jgi:parvulin-like peptidyl-prolyl isomerase